MLDRVGDTLSQLLGLGVESLELWQMVARAVVVYIVGVVAVRLGQNRFIGKFAAFDVILGIMLGSLLSSAIVGAAPFFETLAAALVLVIMHSISARLSFHSDWFGDLIKGSKHRLISKGQIEWDAMAKSQLSKNDLLQALRTAARHENVSKVETAYLERSGDVSVLERNAKEEEKQAYK